MGYCRYLCNIKDLSCHVSDFKLLHLNVQSLLPIQSDLAKLLTNNDIDVCTLNETWLTDKNRKYLKIKNYECITSECKGTKRGGGVGITLSKDVKYTRRMDIEDEISGIEPCVAELTCY